MKKIHFLCLCFVLSLSWNAATADPVCTNSGECSDGRFCNGAERCVPGSPGADSFGCVRSATDACAEGTVCDEANDRCGDPTGCVTNPDRDGDGHDRIECGGDDCNDNDLNRYPGNTEVCDDEGHDEDCDPSTPGRRDADGDGFVDSECRNYRF